MKTIHSIKFYAIIIGFSILCHFHLSGQSIAIKEAQTYFKEVKELSLKDNGTLWGIRLFGPMVFVDQETREGIANAPVPINGWEEINGMYRGTMPQNLGFANTAFIWAGEPWSMVIFNHLSNDKNERGSLLMHELFHQHEDRLGLRSNYELSKHLDKKWGRTLLFLEWNALLKACKLQNEAQIKVIKDALSFRKTRFEFFPEEFSNETRKELHEGLAEYTGMVLCGWDDTGKVQFLEKKVAFAHKENNTLSWTHAYTSGALYGYLLDKQSPGWNKTLKKESDLGKVTSRKFKIDYLSLDKKRLPEIGKPYGFDSILNMEEARTTAARALQKSFIRRFENGSTLLLPNFGLSIQFNPNKITPFGDVGNVYGELTGQSDWGTIKVRSGGILLLQGWKGLVLDVGEHWNPRTSLITDRYDIVLSDGYKIIKTKRGWAIQKKE